MAGQSPLASVCSRQFPSAPLSLLLFWPPRRPAVFRQITLDRSSAWCSTAVNSSIRCPAPFCSATVLHPCYVDIIIQQAASEDLKAILRLSETQRARILLSGRPDRMLPSDRMLRDTRARVLCPANTRLSKLPPRVCGLVPLLLGPCRAFTSDTHVHDEHIRQTETMRLRREVKLTICPQMI